MKQCCVNSIIVYRCHESIFLTLLYLNYAYVTTLSPHSKRFHHIQNEGDSNYENSHRIKCLVFSRDEIYVLFLRAFSHDTLCTDNLGLNNIDKHLNKQTPKTFLHVDEQ